MNLVPKVLLNMNLSIKMLIFTVWMILIPSNAENILVLFPLAFYSHLSSFNPILQTLAAKGHNVTIISPYPQKVPVENITDIIVPNYMQECLDSSSQDFMEINSLKETLTMVWNFGVIGVEKALQNNKIQRFIQSNNTNFDLIISETWFNHEAFVAFGHKFNAPIINVMPLFFFPSSAYLTGNHFDLSYTPVIKPGFTDRMTFIERVQNLFFYYWDILAGQLYYLKIQESFMQKYFKYPGSENRPSMMDMLRNTSLTLMDIHFAIGYPTPLHKNLIPYGGAYLKKSEKLPKDLQDLLDNAKEGVVYFSFGSFATLSNLNPALQQSILSAFSKLKQKVFMRLNDPNLLANYSNKNIIIRKWFPQSSILEHPNCKLFITHCGIHGIMEAIQNAVPMVAIPLIADQIYNSLFIENIGVAYRLLPQDLTEETLLTAINTVLNNPLYQEKIKARSAIFKDTPIDIMDNVIYWIEYVIRHKGAPHLRPAVLDLYWFQYLMLDVIAFYLLLFIVIVFIVYLIIKLFFKCLKLLIFSLLVLFKKKSKNE